MNLKAHDELVANLAADLPGAEVVQTHISSIILSRDIVYKLKKPVDFGFLDYSTLKKRHHCCLAELRSNRRFAPQLYIGIETVTGTADVPMIEGDGEVIDYLVKMHRFDEREQLDHVVDEGRLTAPQVDAIAKMVAAFHQLADALPGNSEYGEPQVLLHPMLENFDYFDLLLDDDEVSAKLADLKVWTLDTYEHLKGDLQSRKAEGFIRECHGDMHLHNMAFYKDELIMFDAIEFNENLSHIDVISDLAFLLMDLDYRGLPHYASRLLNAYLEETGDYGSVKLLSFYKTYRAMVRAKVEALRAAQHPDDSAYGSIIIEVKRYIDLAQSYTRKSHPFLAITRGYSGSGKSSAALIAVERYGALRIRSDVERMRLFGKSESTKTGLDSGIYTPEATEKTYRHLCHTALTVAQSGISVVVDATFLKRWQRKLFEEAAKTAGLKYMILELKCETQLLRDRIEIRASEGKDVSEADIEVLHRQIERDEPLDETERQWCRTIDSTTFEVMERSLKKALE